MKLLRRGGPPHDLGLAWPCSGRHTHRYAAADVEMILKKAGPSGDHSARFRPNNAVLQLLDSI